jgi:hypothetical protein
VDAARLDAEVEALVVKADSLRIELEQEVDLLKRTIAVNRHDTHGLVMRASGIHSKAVSLLVVTHRARLINDLRYPPSDAVAEALGRSEAKVKE